MVFLAIQDSAINIVIGATVGFLPGGDPRLRHSDLMGVLGVVGVSNKNAVFE
jgi:hypothetical protein